MWDKEEGVDKGDKGVDNKVNKEVPHSCTIFLCHLDLEIDDRHRNPNINSREIIWLGNEL